MSSLTCMINAEPSITITHSLLEIGSDCVLIIKLNVAVGFLLRNFRQDDFVKLERADCLEWDLGDLKDTSLD